MKATLEFNLPEESDEHIRAVHGAQYHAIINDVNEQLRKMEKNGVGTVGIETVRALLWDSVKSHGCSYDFS